MENSAFSQLTATILVKQNEWLIRKSVEKALAKSALLREAMELLMEKYEKECKNDEYKTCC